jgi:hypothetical protein
VSFFNTEISKQQAGESQVKYNTGMLFGGSFYKNQFLEAIASYEDEAVALF